MTALDDGRLIDAVARRRDPHAFGELYERYTPAMYGLALRLAGGAESDAEDVVHDAWVRAVERFAAFEGRSSLRSWLCGFVVHRWREVRRAQGRWNPSAVAGEAGSLPSPDVHLETAVDRLDLERAVRELADGYREVLVLHDVEGFTHEEIGALLGIEAGTSKSQLSRARRALRQTLTPHGRGGSS